MKILLFLVTMLLLSSFAMADDGLPGVTLTSLIPVIFGAFVAIVGVLSRFVKVPQAVAKVAASINKDAITFERIDKAVEELLSRGQAPTPFQDWLGDVVATIVCDAPRWLDLSVEQRISIIANLFSKLPFIKAKRVLPVTDEKVLTKAFARERVAAEVLKRSNGNFLDTALSSKVKGVPSA